MSTTEPVLSISGLAVAFRTGSELVTAISDVTIDIAAGETVAIVGESGSGKSTTAAAVNRLLPENGVITAGTIRFDGRELTELPESAMISLRGAGIGLVPQDPMSNLNPLMRVGTRSPRRWRCTATRTAMPRRRASSSCSRWWGSPMPRSACVSTRTSSPAACASAC